jgi:hypothetical protein
MKNWLNKKVIEKDIDGEMVKFQRVPIGTLQKFRNVSDEVSKALGMLFKDTSHDIEVKQMSTPSESVDADGTPFMSSSVDQAAAHPSVLSMRKTQMEEGIRGIINAFMKDESMAVLCEIIAKSAFEEKWPEDVTEIRDSMDTATFILFLKYAFEASAGDYANLGKSLLQNTKVAEVLDQVKTNLT